MAFKLQRKRSFPHLFVGLAVAVLAVAIALRDRISSEWLLSVVGALAAFVYFLYQRHLEETKLFKELFVEFNARYDRLNSDLNRIREAPESKLLEAGDKRILSDYFNLCAEEFLFQEADYIDEKVWQSWLRGMAYYAGQPRILAVWREEVGQESYYGFRLEEVERLLPRTANSER
jgi:hypothetical protein